MSTTTKTTEKIILEFDQRGFEYASAMFNEKKQFTISVENEKETERYNHALKLIETINKTRSLTNEFPALNMYLMVFKSVIRLDGTGNNFEPSPMFVKGIF